MVSSSDPIQMTVDSPVDRDVCGRVHKYYLYAEKHPGGSLEYSIDYRLRPSVVESVTTGLKSLFSEEDVGMPDKYMESVPDTVAENIYEVIDERVQTSRFTAGRQQIGECQIECRLPREYRVRVDIGREYLSRA